MPEDPKRPRLSALSNVRNGAKAVAFYKQAFGAEEIFCFADPNGEVVAQLTIGNSDFWLADESPAHFNSSPDTLGGCSVRMIVTVDDPDAFFLHAVAAGATIVWPVENKSYGWRVGRLADPFGHHWEDRQANPALMSRVSTFRNPGI